MTPISDSTHCANPDSDVIPERSEGPLRLLEPFKVTLTHLPHPEECCGAARLEGWATGKVRVPTLR
ncbi:hypothetical protein, partial [uncultured Reyranella sp.]|uniref:hypothetical protein n=1 Tax=uncultured Reyranella sp. TaxID=735512 RepID=UPI00259CC941